jgi:actin related protein 2/3 complex subunit 3
MKAGVTDCAVDVMKQYLSQLRQEIANRLPEKVYPDGGEAASKWWLMFAKRKFMNKSL